MSLKNLPSTSRRVAGAVLAFGLALAPAQTPFAQQDEGGEVNPLDKHYSKPIEEKAPAPEIYQPDVDEEELTRRYEAFIALTDGYTEVGNAALGRQLYEEGIGVDGEPITAYTKGDIEISGAQFTCISCHRASGMGTSEGGAYVPPITAKHLFTAREADVALREERFKETYKEAQSDSFKEDLRKPRLRPAYDPETLATAVREGVDPVGRTLNAVMPRYAISEADGRNLTAFFATLSREGDPGVGQRKIHFATVVSKEADRAKATAMVNLVRAYSAFKNKDTIADSSHSGYSPFYRSQFLYARRFWEPHIWVIEGDPETWDEQLAAHYEKQPVFALISGLVEGPFDPVANFCDAERLPCIFPNTPLPRTEDAEGGYAIYLSRGLELEAEALAVYLARSDAAPERILQLHVTDDPFADVPAAAFADRVAIELPATNLQTRGAADSAALAAAIAEAGSAAEADVLVIWPGRATDPALAALESVKPAMRVALPLSAMDPAKTALSEWAQKRVIFTSRYDRPDAIHPDSYRVRAWVRSRGLDIPDWDIMRNTYFALRTLEFSMDHLLADFYRDYLIEIIEHQVESGFDPGPYPQGSLGPRQRFYSKGAYMMGLDPESHYDVSPVSEWVVP